MDISFKEVLNLDHNIGGFVAKITSPKAIRHKEDNAKYYTYSFHTDGVLTNDEGVEQINSDGIYQVIDICKWRNDSELQWNIYLVVVDGEDAYPVAEYLNSPCTQWVKEARHIVKAYYEGEELDVIDITPKPKRPKHHKYNRETINRLNPAKSSKKESVQEDRKNAKEKKKDENKPSKTLHKTEKKMKKKPSGRSQETKPLKEGEVRLMTFTGMIIGTYPMKRHNKKYIEIDTDKGTLRFSRETCRQVNVPEGKERYANKIEYKLKG